MIELLLIFIYSLLFIFIIYKWKWFRDEQVRNYIFIILFALKVIAGITAGEIYKQRYDGGDTYCFFDDSKVITTSFFESKLDFLNIMIGNTDDLEFMKKYGGMNCWYNEDVVYNDSRTIIRFHAVMGLISGGYYNIHVIFIAFLSMMGLMALYKVTRLLTDQNPHLLMAAIFLVPGVIFWCSAASKESILIFAMGMFLYHCVRLLTVSKSVGNMIGMFLAGFLFIHIKAYLLILITPCLLAFTWVHVTNQKYSLLKYGFIYLSFGLLFFNAKYLIQGFDPVEILLMKRMNFEAYANASPIDFGSYIELPEFTSDWGDLITVTPIAFFSVISRPYIWESSSILILFAALENILIFICMAIGLRYIKWDRMAINKNLLLFCIFFIFSVFTLIGLTSPVMGAIVRYKAPVLPFLMLIPLLITGVTTTRKL